MDTLYDYTVVFDNTPEQPHYEYRPFIVMWGNTEGYKAKTLESAQRWITSFLKVSFYEVAWSQSGDEWSAEYTSVLESDNAPY